MTRLVAAADEHVEAIASIYAAAARSSVSTFDLEGAPPEYWRAKLESTAAGDHVLVALDAAGAVAGFAYSGAFRPRAGYARTRETSIYLRQDRRGAGVGRRLYTELLERLRTDGMHLAVAVVAQPNPASNALHRRLGFREVGTLEEVGFKFGRWVSTTWWERRLG